jgi:hypothetical protein
VTFHTLRHTAASLLAELVVSEAETDFGEPAQQLIP